MTVGSGIPAFAGMGKEKEPGWMNSTGPLDNINDFKRTSLAFERKSFGVLVERPGQYQDTLNKTPKAANA